MWGAVSAACCDGLMRTVHIPDSELCVEPRTGCGHLPRVGLCRGERHHTECKLHWCLFVVQCASESIRMIDAAYSLRRSPSRNASGGVMPHQLQTIFIAVTAIAVSYPTWGMQQAAECACSELTFIKFPEPCKRVWSQAFQEVASAPDRVYTILVNCTMRFISMMYLRFGHFPRRSLAALGNWKTSARCSAASVAHAPFPCSLVFRIPASKFES